MTTTAFRTELERLINQESMEGSIEGGSDTPDFILADYLMACLAAFDEAVRRREEWYGRKKRVVNDLTGIDLDRVPD